MRVIKLGLISVVAFYLLIWGFSLLIPSTTIVSRIINITGSTDSLAQKLNNNSISYRQWLIGNDTSISIKTSDISFYTNDIFNAERQPNADTIYFEMIHQNKPLVQGGLGLYQIVPDSATTQLFYVFKSKWYKPWEKMAFMVNESKYGGQMDSALHLLKRISEGK